MNALAAKLKQAAPHASVDDHRRWITRLRGLAEGWQVAPGALLPDADFPAPDRLPIST